MERGEFCHDQYMLVDYMQDVGEVHARARCVCPVFKKAPHNGIFGKIVFLSFIYNSLFKLLFVEISNCGTLS